MRLVTLTTDFGTEDGYVGEVKGVLLSRCPEARLVDVTHRIPAGDVEFGAWVLDRTWERYPAGTVHLVVVDPGVGSERRAIAALTGERWFVGPDNGLLTRVAGRLPIRELREITAAGVTASAVSLTFHGRDLFAPAAAIIAELDGGESLGPLLDPTTLVRIDLPLPQRYGDRIEGRVMHVDRFGNLITDVPADWLPEAPLVAIRGRRLRGLVRSYAAAQGGRGGPLLAIVGSGGTLEISMAGGSAAALLSARRGDRVTVSPPGP
ncbi:MAG: S-adenosyl-l-methionine hydroxide adenosyltransferase family protein [Gemmatimonadota bacterium]